MVRKGPAPTEVEKTTDVLMSHTQVGITLVAGLSSILAALLSSVWNKPGFSWIPVEIWVIPVILWVIALLLFFIQVLGRWRSQFVHKHLYHYLRGGPDP